MTNLERISDYLREEGCPKTPQEISNWADISLPDVYETLRGNKVFFIEIIKDESLVGWITAW
jgi:hypothetical protein